MKKTALFPFIALMALAACEDTATAPAPTNTTELNSTGGPCGDGTKLGPNEQCK